MKLWRRKRQRRSPAPAILRSEAEHLRDLVKQYATQYDDGRPGLTGSGLIGAYGGGLIEPPNDPSKTKVFDDELSDDD